MRDALAPTNALALLHALVRVRDLEDTRARDVVVLLLNHVHDLGHVLRCQPMVAVHRKQGGLQVVGGEVSVWAPVRVAWARLVGHEDLLAAMRAHYQLHN